MYRRFRLFPSCLALFVVGCLGSSSLPFVGKGPVPLSATNPFIGPNYFLGQQLGQGRFLRELFLLRGGPDAIEVIDTDSLLLYYLGHRQTYYADRIGGAHDSSEWVVRGPFVMSRRQFFTLKKLGIYPGAAPLFVVNGRLTNFRLPPTPTAVPTPVPRLMAPARPVPRRRGRPAQARRAVIRAPGAVSTGSYSKTGTSMSPDATPNADQRALSATRATPLSIELLEQILKGGSPATSGKPSMPSVTATSETPTTDKPRETTAAPSPTSPPQPPASPTTASTVGGEPTKEEPGAGDPTDAVRSPSPLPSSS